MTIRSAIVLAAGLGTRLRPLTDHTPKPLLDIGDKRLIDFPLEQLVKAGVHEVVINLHYKGDAVQDYVGDGQRYGLHVRYSAESALLGTGGGIKQAATLLADASIFFVVNGDIFCDLDLRALRRTHEHSANAAATLAIRTLAKGDTYTPLQVDSSGRLIAMGEGTDHYTGILIGTTRLLDQLPPAGQPSCLVQQGLHPLLKNGVILSTYRHVGVWSDVGTPEDLAAVRAQCMNPPCLPPENSS